MKNPQNTPENHFIEKQPALFTHKIIRWTIRFFIGLIFIIGLLIGIVIIETLRAKYAFNKYCLELECKGESLNFESYIPQLPPSEKNFGTITLLTSFFNYSYDPQTQSFKEDPQALTLLQTVSLKRDICSTLGSWLKGQSCDLEEWASFFKDDPECSLSNEVNIPPKIILLALEQFSPIISEIKHGSSRPYAVYPIKYETTLIYGPPLSHLNFLRNLSGILTLQAIAFTKLGQIENALENLRLIFYLADSLKMEPFIISQLVRISIINMAIQVIWEGLREHKWQKEQLNLIEKMIGEVDLLATYTNAIRAERAFWLYKQKHYKFLPFYWYFNMLEAFKLVQETFLEAIDLQSRKVHPETIQSGISKLTTRRWYNILAHLLISPIESATIRFTFGQVSLDLCNCACKIEKYYLDNGKYPDDLFQLMPTYANFLPLDIMGGKPFIYLSNKDSKGYIVYSIGWNMKDDGGIVSKDNRANELKDNDWCWKLP